MDRTNVMNRIKKIIADTAPAISSADDVKEDVLLVDQGIDSLDSVQIQQGIEDDFNIMFEGEVTTATTVNALTDYVLKHAK
jgi:acyl carrier protein